MISYLMILAILPLILVCPKSTVFSMSWSSKSKPQQLSNSRGETFFCFFFCFFLTPGLIDDIAFQKKNKCILVGGGSQKRQSVCYIYDRIIFPVGFSFCLIPLSIPQCIAKSSIAISSIMFFSSSFL